MQVLRFAQKDKQNLQLATAKAKAKAAADPYGMTTREQATAKAKAISGGYENDRIGRGLGGFYEFG